MTTFTLTKSLLPLLASALFGTAGVSLAAAPSAPVNTFIGTQDDGNTFPGASAPFGMLQVSPIGEHYAGWHYTDPKIRGFGHFFLSRRRLLGTGAASCRCCRSPAASARAATSTPASRAASITSCMHRTIRTTARWAKPATSRSS